MRRRGRRSSAVGTEVVSQLPEVAAKRRAAFRGFDG